MKMLKFASIRNSLLIAWSIAIIATVLVMSVVGSIYSIEQAKDYLGAMQRSSLYYGSAIATSSATILALVLTMLGLSKQRDGKGDKSNFVQFRAIATFCVYAFIGAIVLLLAVSFPVQDFKEVPDRTFKYLFYAICIWNGMLAGHLIAIILILRQTVLSLIGAIRPEFDDESAD